MNDNLQQTIETNLCSDSPEVRINAIVSLAQAPIALNQKLEYLKIPLNDPVPEIKKYAKEIADWLIASQSQGQEQEPSQGQEQSQSQSQSQSQEPSQNQGGSFGQKAEEPLNEQAAEPQGNMLFDSGEASNLSLPGLNEVMTESAPSQSASGAPSQSQSAGGAPSQGQSVGGAPSQAQNAWVSESSWDDPLDPSLPDISTITDVQQLFEYVKFLAQNKPSGHASQLFSLIKHPSEEVALTALQTLLNLKDHRIPRRILPLMAESGFSSQKRFLMLKIVMETSQPLSTDLIAKIMNSEKDVIIKSGLVKVYARNLRGGDTTILLECLSDPDPRVRANTVEVIEEQNIKGCEQNIIRLLNDSENRVKVNAAKYLVKLGYTQAFTTLRGMLVSQEVWLRDSVIFALGEIGDQQSMILLRAALKDPNQGIRLSVLKALAKINNSTSRQTLKAAAADLDPVVAQVADSLYTKIKDRPENPQFTLPVAQVFMGQADKTEQSAKESKTALNQNKADKAQSAKETPASRQQTKPTLQEPSNSQAQAAKPTPQEPSTPQAQAAKPTPQEPSNSQAQAASLDGMPKFERTRSAGIYQKLCSSSLEEQRAGARDIPFIMGKDQLILLKKAVEAADEGARITAVKLLARKKEPEVKQILQGLKQDSNETIRSLVEKALLMLK